MRVLAFASSEVAMGAGAGEELTASGCQVGNDTGYNHLMDEDLVNGLSFDD